MTARTANLGPPPAAPKPPEVAPAPQKPVQSTLGGIPDADEHKGNLSDGKLTQIGLRIPDMKHRDIKIVATQQGLTITDYLLMLHDEFSAKKKKRG